MGLQLIGGTEGTFDSTPTQTGCAEGNSGCGLMVDFGGSGAAGGKLWPGSNAETSSVDGSGASGSNCCALVLLQAEQIKSRTKTVLLTPCGCLPAVPDFAL